ncbi:MAG: SDR family NAD(P)-dependent oxidoreductase [Paracoccus sp. (in: a-proteobacteria)]|uniref:SDR family NAD(P)-dependent oxidoreductase n=1 Tax=Paracoccus sp. TaxID=267 RepID=UPI0026E047C2|nr:SDR family NAD(P)-dependent oxidoreductase [Paracoccus sp. (in: a-proteobacteria)]MDO5621125.1 SDR family NAD(P)-dependent oxidoreductase [Paracoccus sp. (in: a-proteobacteria)]
MEQNTQKIALVTGASRGLGAAIAEALGAKGWHVLAVARTTGALEELDDRIRAAGGEGATLAPMDVSIPEAMGQLAQAVRQRWGGLDLWVHAAIHAAPLTPAGHIDDKDWGKCFAVNMDATRGLIGMIGPLLQARQGTALFFDDPRGGQPYFGAYGATKAGQMALARSWQAESAKLGPRVVIAEPQPMPTAIRGRFFPGEARTPLAPCKDEAARILHDMGY